MSIRNLSGVHLLAGACSVLLGACHWPRPHAAPAVEFTKLPPAEEGTPDRLHAIEGRVAGAQPGQRIVLFARSGLWWVQPTEDRPFTTVEEGSRWRNVTHPGAAYAALLVTPQYRPALTLEKLPARGGDVLAVTVAEGAVPAPAAPRTIHFSGYDWHARELASDRGGTRNRFDPANAWTDDRGRLHLRIARRDGEWTAAEVRLSRSLGYGSYRFVVRDISRLEPAAVFSMLTWDDSAPSREMDIEISRWGEPAAKNAQFVVQPYYVPANAVRFTAPPGVLTHSFRWEPGRVSFRTARGSGGPSPARVVDEHTFTSGIPAPGNESVRINLSRFDNKAHPLRRECEVIVERFEYLP